MRASPPPRFPLPALLSAGSPRPFPPPPGGKEEAEHAEGGETVKLLPDDITAICIRAGL